MLKPVILALFFCGFLLAGPGSASAQPAPPYETISIAQGLSQGMIFDLLQDRDGFIWVATKNGLNRYDGYQFKIFTNDPYNPRSLSGNTINNLLEDSKGRIWAGTDHAGVNIYDKGKDIFYRISHRREDPGSLSGNNIKSMLEMNDGRMLVGTVNEGLNVITLSRSFFEKGTPATITRLALPGKTMLYGMGKDQQGGIWVGGMDGKVYQFNPAQNSFTPVPGAKLYNSGYYTDDGSVLANNHLFFANGPVLMPLFDTAAIHPGNLLLNPRGALWNYIHREHYFYDFARYVPGRMPEWNRAIPADTTRRICYPFLVDRSGILWSGSVGYGLRKYNITGRRFITEVAGKSVRMLVPTPDNDIIWADYGYGWKKLNDSTASGGAFEKIPSLAQIDNFIISRQNIYWIKSDKSGYYKYDPARGVLQPFPAINPEQALGYKQPFIEDSRGRIWFPGKDGIITLLHTADETITRFNLGNVPAKSLVTAIYEDKQGEFWVGTENGFASIHFPKESGQAPRIKWYYNDINTRNSLSYNHVSCFLDDPVKPESYIWISTKGGGLNRFTKSSGEFIHITGKQGLPDEVVYGILADDAGNIWGSTNKGIFCMPAAEDKENPRAIRNFTKADGLQDNEFNTGAFVKLPGGQLAFGGVNGFNIFDPAAILETSFTPNVLITGIFVNNQPLLPAANPAGETSNSPLQKISLGYLQDILTIEFSSLDFTAPGQNKYRYQMVGIDKDWVESGTRHTVTYLHLPSGSYTFRVQGSNSQGVWSTKTAALKITIHPPWWRTWWAYLLYGLLLTLGVRSYFKFRINKTKLQAQLNFEQQEAHRVKELDTLKTQLYANITHEFRTPLTVILGMANQVKSNPEQHLDNGIEMITRNGRNLLNLVNEMLDLSKLENGKMTLNLINGDIISFLRYIVESFQSLAASQQKQFHFLADTDELAVAFDAEKIRQVITNLFSNALKFTPASGNVYVSISQEPAADNDHTVLVLKVKDTGTGIPENQLPHIFDRFYQLDNSQTRKAEGTGIGLALTRELVKLMDGTIVVKSPPVGATKGTEFIITIPLQKVSTTGGKEMMVLPFRENNTIPPAAEKPAPRIVEPVHSDSPAPLILLVEDNADVVAYTAGCLPEYKLAVGRDGREGFDIATELVPDLIITDVMMPFSDGFEMSRKLRQDERTSHIPIIMLTAKADMQSKLEGLEKGADVYLEKPFHKEELLLRIRKLLENRRSLQQYYMKLAGMAPSEIAVPPPEEAAENEFVLKVRDIIGQHLDDYHFSVEQLCKLVFMSHSQLHRKLHALVGCSPNKFIRVVRLARARELLLSSGDSIAGIALACGFTDPGYFARVFRQETGCTPQEWKSRQRGQK